MRFIVFATPLLLASVSLSGAETQAVHVAPGTYSFYFEKKLLFFGSHRERGMEGALEVVP